ncbi:unannotated protein [freshwater metagenome]|uniref:Unannotated protein n=1 Tax=freshwater metagenome TaxID=449393 RepID=A0A6J7ICJ7_9ZZZZ
MQFTDDTLEGAGHLDGGFSRLYLDDDLIDGDGVAGLDLPFHDLGLGQSLAEVGQQKYLGTHTVTALLRSGASFHCNRSIASRTRSADGRWKCSSFGAG